MSDTNTTGKTITGLESETLANMQNGGYVVASKTGQSKKVPLSDFAKASDVPDVFVIKATSVPGYSTVNVDKTYAQIAAATGAKILVYDGKVFNFRCTGTDDQDRSFFRFVSTGTKQLQGNEWYQQNGYVYCSYADIYSDNTFSHGFQPTGVIYDGTEYPGTITGSGSVNVNLCENYSYSRYVVDSGASVTGITFNVMDYFDGSDGVAIDWGCTLYNESSTSITSIDVTIKHGNGAARTLHRPYNMASILSSGAKQFQIKAKGDAFEITPLGMDPISVSYPLFEDIQGHHSLPTTTIDGQTWSIIPSSVSYTDYTFTKNELIDSSESSFDYVEIEFDKYVLPYSDGANGMDIGSGVTAYRNHHDYPDYDVLMFISSSSSLSVKNLYNGATTYTDGDNIVVLGKSGRSGLSRREKYVYKQGIVEIYTDGDLMATINNPATITGPSIYAWNETGTGGVGLRNLKIKCFY